MPQPRKKASPAKGEAAAAAAETDSQPHVVEHAGLRLELPAELPSEILFDIIEIEASDGTANAYLVCLRVLRSLVGVDQFTTIRHRIGSEVDEVVGLLNTALAPYGLSLGESEASPDS